jgi:hypothetical protein
VQAVPAPRQRGDDAVGREAVSVRPVIRQQLGRMRDQDGAGDRG